MRVLRNPNHDSQPEIIDLLSRLQSDTAISRDRMAGILAAARPTFDERRARLDVMSGGGAGLGRDAVERHESLRDAKFRHFSDIAGVAVRQGPSWHDYLVPQDPAPAAPVDHTFWWGETDPFIPGHMGAHWDNAGLHFTGGPTHHDGDLFNTNFGATALFDIKPDRLPTSPNGLFSSTPYIELFGGLLGYTGDADILTGDLWSKCWLHLRQTVLQFAFGPTGPVPIVLGNAESHETLIFEENAERSVHVNLPGFKPMPAVIFGGVNRAYPVHAHLEVRFDIQLEGAGTLLWCDPEVLLRTFQWPMNPL